MRLLLSTLFFFMAWAAEEETKNSQPSFFLIDGSDQLCLAGEEFKRCSIDSLFYVVGNPGTYQIYKRPADGVVDEEEDGTCIAVKSCKEADLGKPMDAKLAKCSHCGSKNWNIVGDTESGYVLMHGDGKTCLVREAGTNKAMTGPCDAKENPYTPLQLQFASSGDIKTMSSDGARLIGAASDGDKKLVQSLLNEGVDINVRDWDDLTALIPAASAGHMEICKLLVKEGIDINAKDKDGITALMEASIMGHNKVVEFLIENGADVNAAASSEVTALWLSASEGRVEVMKTLLKNGADSTITRVDGISALMTASVGGHSETVKLLLENGADPTVTDRDGLTPLMNAAENGNVSILKLLIQHVDDPKYVNAMSNTGYSPLIVASANGHAEAVEYLIEAGSEVDATHDDSKVTALMYAAAHGKIETMKVLVEKGKAGLDVKHSNGGTALLEAASTGQLDAMKFLVDLGAEVDYFDDDGVSPLMAVASAGDAESQTVILEALKKLKTPEELTEHINKLSYSGGSSVMFAASGGHLECAKQLMEYGADITKIARAVDFYEERLAKMIEEGTVQHDEPHVDGVTSLHVAAQGGYLEMVNMLLESGADVFHLDDAKRSALVLAVQGNHGEVASVLVAAGSDPNIPYVDDDGESHNLLFDAIVVENEEFALLLIEKGADIYYQDEKKVTTLLQASHRGLTNTVEALLKSHASSGKDGFINDPSEDGITPLVAASSEGNADCAKLLLGAQADVSAKDKDGTNALMAAAARGHLDVVSLLLDSGANINEQNSDGHTALMFAYNGKNQVETLWERYNQYVSDAKNDANSKGDADDNGTGPIIREALDNHTALVELLLKNGADTKLKDKEGHVAKDFDFHPDADGDILEKEARAEKARDESKNEL